MSRKQTGIAIWTCDRCGGYEESSSTSLVPKGWECFSGFVHALNHKDICATCVASLVEWFKEGAA